MTWEPLLIEAIRLFIDEEVVKSSVCLDSSHFRETPQRFVSALKEYTSGVAVDPARFLLKEFSHQQYDELIHLHDVEIVSLCAHHWAPILGKCHFAYVPDDHIVGLSKIPRMIEALAHRPQVQENLTTQIVDIFQDVVKPKGCAVSIRAFHMCMGIRGVKQHGIITETTALRGIFQSSQITRSEFLLSIDRSKPVWP